MAHLAGDGDSEKLRTDIKELRKAVGLEYEESA
jgi:hypothetical protein